MIILATVISFLFALLCIAIPARLIPSNVGSPCGGRPATHRCMAGLVCAPNNTCVALGQGPSPTPGLKLPPLE
ncbi:hypothetical protein BDF22DRAFT_700079 [Syncephalis plumigaleata]|nr:hypothetical protein BDF22DRAFT_700079 [Syncephalis plumigaleata]